MDTKSYTQEWSGWPKKSCAHEAGFLIFAGTSGNQCRGIWACHLYLGTFGYCFYLCKFEFLGPVFPVTMMIKLPVASMLSLFFADLADTIMENMENCKPVNCAPNFEQCNFQGNPDSGPWSILTCQLPELLDIIGYKIRNQSLQSYFGWFLGAPIFTYFQIMILACLWIISSLSLQKVAIDCRKCQPRQLPVGSCHSIQTCKTTTWIHFFAHVWMPDCKGEMKEGSGWIHYSVGCFILYFGFCSFAFLKIVSKRRPLKLGDGFLKVLVWEWSCDRHRDRHARS